MKWVVVAGFLLCFANNIRAGVRSRRDLPFGRECLPGSKWQSQCNSCTCTDDGRPACTDRLCPGQENERMWQCAPSTQWEIECYNTCVCGPDGLAGCTDIGCAEENPYPSDREGVEKESSEPNSSLIRKARATSQETPKACQPGQEFRMDCNKCLCDNEGQDFSCTRIDCASLHNNNNGGVRRKREVATQAIDCTPGSVLEQGCKLCRCAEDGRHAVCPTHCQNEKEHSENDISNTDSDPSFRCNPGEQFKRSCNDCTCSADGRSFFCTLRLCEQEITPSI